MGLDIVERLKKEHGYTNEDLAKLSGVPKGTIDKITAGATKDPKLGTLKALARVLGCTLDDFDDYQPIGKPTNEEWKHIKKYRDLDDHGKEMVSLALDCEARRMETAKGKQAQAPRMKVIPLLGNSFAAGRGDPDFGNPWEDYEVPADSKAEFAVRINGDSMEPYLHDGSIALGVKRAPRDGEVAALILDGDFICKQVRQDTVGNLYLFALNRSRKDADQTIWHNQERSLTCFGTILMDHVPLPKD